MDNTQLPPIAPAGPVPQEPVQVAPQPLTAPNGAPMVKEVKVVEEKKDIAGLIKTIVIIVVSLVAVTFIGLFIWMTMQYNEVQANYDSEMRIEVAKAKDEAKTEAEAICQEEKNYPYKTFIGPEDYGGLTFQYEKEWSVYIAAAATEGGDFNAYFNPIQVDAVGKDTINALRVTILNKSFDVVTADYQKAMDKKNSNLTMESITFGKDDGITGNKYTGTIPNTDLSGFIVIFKSRDKTAILQTDSVIFE